jgi:CHAT domain-containing protein
LISKAFNQSARWAGFLTVALLLNAAIAKPQTPSTSEVAAASTQTQKSVDILANARKLHSQEGPAKALPAYEKALALFRQEGDRKNEAITIGLMGNAYKRLGEHAKALDFLQRSLSLKRELGDRLEEGKTLSNIGLFYWETSDYPKAVEFFTQASDVANELKDRKLEAAILNNVGLVYDELGDYRKSLEHFNRALELYRGSEPSQGMADAIGNIGGNHFLRGNYAEALRYYEQALAIDEKLESKPSIALDLQNIGLSLTGLGRTREAIQALDRATSLAHDAGLKKEEADSRKAKASAFLQLGRYAEALEQYNQAKEVYERTAAGAAGFKLQLIEALGDLGNLKIRLGDAASAEADFRRAIELSEALKHPRGVTNNLISLGDLNLRQSRFSEAVGLYTQALNRALDADDKANTATAKLGLAHVHLKLKRLQEAEQQARKALDIARATQARPLEAETLYALAEVLRANNRQQEALTTFAEGSTIVNDLNNPELSWRFDFGRGQSLEAVGRNEEALTAYQTAVKTIETVRSELREERFRAGYIEDKYQVYVTLVRLLLRMGRAEEAFLASEKLRARSYLDLLGRGQPPIRNQAERQREETLRSRVRELQKNLEKEAAKAPRDQRRQAIEIFSKELNAAEQEYEIFVDDLSRSEPSYAAARSLKVVSSDEVRRRLPADAALLEYVVGENEIVIFVLTRKGLHAKTTPISSEDLQSRVETLRDLMLRYKTLEWKLPASSLFKTLITPVENAGWLRGVRQLYLIPHAILHYVPFAVLKNTDKTLVDSYVLAYLPAAAALIHGKKSSAASSSILAMAPSNTRLQYTRLESKSVSDSFPGKNTLLLGSLATESSFKRLASGFDIIHLATHGYFNKRNPLLSGLMLEPDTTDDGRLEVHEIMGLRLNANLVTLSACETAVGTGYFSAVPPGDDLVGLTRAFLSTGAPSVLATLWEVNDRSAVNFMEGFYGRLLNSDKATALANAQRQMRTRGRYTHPYYWAPFVLVGEMK